MAYLAKFVTPTVCLNFLELWNKSAKSLNARTVKRGKCLIDLRHCHPSRVFGVRRNLLVRARSRFLAEKSGFGMTKGRHVYRNCTLKARRAARPQRDKECGWDIQH